MTNHDHHLDEQFMLRALELARRGQGSVSPNPMVGSVVVHQGKIIGEGWHQQYGGPHAEVNALASVEDKNLLSQSTIYVNLEPCSHYGKTPPCADMLIANRLQRVVVANQDSNPLVAGAGIRKLRSTGIEVTTGVLENEGRNLNKRFFTWVEKKRPYVILKWAQTSDGFIARENGDSKWISNVYARQLVHRWRTEEDAILVGSGTVKQDNPMLNVRDWSGRNPVRIVIDRHSKLDRGHHVFDGSQKTIVYTLNRAAEEFGFRSVQLTQTNFFDGLMQDLYKQQIQSVIIEGGAQTLHAFIQNNVWDEARIFIADKSFGDGIAAPLFRGNLIGREMLMNDLLEIYDRSRETQANHQSMSTFNAS